MSDTWHKAVKMAEAHRQPVGVYDFGGISICGLYKTYRDKGLTALTADPSIADMPPPFVRKPREAPFYMPAGGL